MKINRRFGWDFDDTLVELTKAYNLYHLKMWNCLPSFDAVHGLDRGIQFIQSTDHTQVEAVKGALEVLQYLQKTHQLFLVTARSRHLRKPTLQLSEKFFPGIFTASNSYFINMGGKNKLGTKGDVCRRLGITSFVEDSVAHATEIANAGVQSFLLTTPANKEIVLPNNVIRIASLNEIMQYTS